GGGRARAGGGRPRCRGDGCIVVGGGVVGGAQRDRSGRLGTGGRGLRRHRDAEDGCFARGREGGGGAAHGGAVLVEEGEGEQSHPERDREDPDLASPPGTEARLGAGEVRSHQAGSVPQRGFRLQRTTVYPLRTAV